MAVLSGRRVAMLVEEEFEDLELTGPLDALRAAGAVVTLVGPTQGAAYRGKRGAAVVTADLAAGSVRLQDFDALVIPGGHAPDKMRMRHAMVDLTREAMETGKPVVEDGNLITSRKPDDVPAFSDAIIRALSRVPA